MPRRKHIKIARVRNLPNVFEHTEGLEPGWHQEFFQLNAPLVLELGCGSGAFVLQLAAMQSGKNYIGVDIKGARIWRGAHDATDSGVSNIAFLRTPIDRITEYFYPGEVTEIWITFPDPYAKKYNTNRRLTSEYYLTRYHEILTNGGIIHVKTDDQRLFDFTLRTLATQNCQLLAHIDDLHTVDSSPPAARLLTDYEKKYIADQRPIYYLSFRFDT